MRIKTAAIRLNGQIIATGITHEAASLSAGGVTGERGFITDNGQFVDRKTAAGIALGSGQAREISDPSLGLSSSDLVADYPTVDSTGSENSAPRFPSIEQVDRLLIDYYWPELAKKADDHWDDPEMLQRILEELAFRQRSRAQDLRAKVAARLTEISRDYFLWPETAVLPSSEALERDQFWYSRGLLSFMGYRVGQQGISPTDRHDILDYVYSKQIPRVNSAEYMNSWGDPRTRPRLQKLAESLAAFTRNAKRVVFADMTEAIWDWENDLEYLKTTYYEGRYDFTWPAVD